MIVDLNNDPIHGSFDLEARDSLLDEDSTDKRGTFVTLVVDFVRSLNKKFTVFVIEKESP